MSEQEQAILDKLYECPFCQTKRVSLFRNFVICLTCHAKGPVGQTKEHGAQLWNTR